MHDSEALSALEQAASSLWTLIDDVSTTFAGYENAHDDVAIQLKAMRRSYASSLRVFHRLREFEGTVHDGIEQFAQKIGQFESHISSTALNYGLNLLPDVVLYEILVFAGTGLEEKVVLSLVCKRFRSVMMSMRGMWDSHLIVSDQTPEENIAVAEGNGFVSLKAYIDSRSRPPSYVKTWVAKRGLDLEEYTLRYYKFSVGLIVSLNPEELKFLFSDERDWKKVESILAGRNMQNLRSLTMLRAPRNSVGARLLESWHIPLLQNLKVEFVPRATLARNLMRCSLYKIEESDFDSLKEFLSAAKSLQELQLFFSETRSRFYEFYDLPSLRSLDVNFVPHPSLAGHLVRFELSLPSNREVSLSELLYFLSLPGSLQELAVIRSNFSDDPDTIDASPVVTMPSVVSCSTWCCKTGLTLIAKLRMPVLRTLKLTLRRPEMVSTAIRDEFRTSLRSMPSLEKLELRNEQVGVADLDEIIRYAPPHLESFSLKMCWDFLTVSEGWNTAPAPRRNLIRFSNCRAIFPKFMPIFVDYLRAVELGRVRIQLESFPGYKEGTSELDDVMSAARGSY